MLGMKKVICSILVFALALIIPAHTFAETQTEVGIDSLTIPSAQHVTLSIPLEINDLSSVSNSVYDGGITTQKAKVVYADLDFWVDVDGSTALGNWTVTMRDKKHKITSVNISLVWSNGEKDSFKYSTFGVPTHVSNQGETEYSNAGLHSAKLYGSVYSTGASFSLPANGAKVTFTTK
ncbi:hypothetical protein [Paenibacillus massiliensis]|uniref:hypothetical protein n=1 Tax=Paenibacillus massiliensis TaxID=225917 RepID=UPI000472CBDD|nr:hypothetical protein [Paenibacillus massiliensis]